MLKNKTAWLILIAISLFFLGYASESLKLTQLRQGLNRDIENRKMMSNKVPAIISDHNPRPLKSKVLIPTYPDGVIPIADLVFPSELSIREEIRKQIQEGAEGTPPSIQHFTQSIAPHMKKALTDQRYALKVFRKMEECLRDQYGKLPTVVNSLCLLNARRIARRFPGPFQEKYEALENVQSLSARNLSQLIESKSLR